MHFHTFFTGTCKYQLPMLLNDLNSNDIMSEVIKNIKGALYPKIYFFLIFFFYIIYISNKYIYTLKGQKLKRKLKDSLRGMRDSTERPKIRRQRFKGYRKI